MHPEKAYWLQMFKKDTPGSRGPPLTPLVPREKKVNISFYIQLSALLARVRESSQRT